MHAKDIVGKICERMEEHGGELMLSPREWGIFGATAKRFPDEVLEEAINRFPTNRLIETPSRLFVHICKQVANETIKTSPINLNIGKEL